ncbi:MAG: hypothetical protein BGO29_14825 [Bacteroidales bacterium 36-12]|nr:MAG: hypothetical protein BGO29_14825 [Bacteroidales bacterium 36-12]
MSIYEAILNIDEATFDRLMSLGVLRSNAKRDLLIYEYYLSECERHGSMQAMTNTSEEFKVSEDIVQRIVYRAPYNKKIKE